LQQFPLAQVLFGQQGLPATPQGTHLLLSPHASAGSAHPALGFVLVLVLGQQGSPWPPQ
jgi:hypothetical protein